MAVLSQKKAKRYARALFEVSAPAELESILEELKKLVVLVDKNPLLLEVAQNPGYSKSERASALSAVVAKSGCAEKRIINLMSTLVENSSVQYLPAIEEVFASLVLEFKKAVAIEVISAFPMDSDEVSAIKQKIEKQFGKVVTVSTSTDPELIGGVVLKVGDKVLDRSWAGALQSAAIELTN